MVIYVRTEAGQQAAYSAQSPLPRKLKSILKLVDGKTSLEVFGANLNSFGDVRGIFRSLDLAGLIYAQPDTAHAVRVNSDIRDSERMKLKEQGDAGSWSATRTPYGSPASPETLQLNENRDTEFQTPEVGARRSKTLKTTVDLMSKFVLTHMAEDSFQILKEVEEISSLELLAVTLGGYEQMIAHLGEPSKLHIQHLKQILRDNL